MTLKIIVPRAKPNPKPHKAPRNVEIIKILNFLPSICLVFGSHKSWCSAPTYIEGAAAVSTVSGSVTRTGLVVHGLELITETSLARQHITQLTSQNPAKNYLKKVGKFTLLHFVGFCIPHSLLFSEIDNPNDWADILTYIHLHGTFICLPYLSIVYPP